MRILVVLVPLAIVIFGIVAGMWAWHFSPEAETRRKARRDSVMAESATVTALENYRLLQRAINLHQDVLDVDAMFPTLTPELRVKIVNIVSEFNNNQLPKGSI